jgi:DNA-binding NarL/FixJ family response regulator
VDSLRGTRRQGEAVTYRTLRDLLTPREFGLVGLIVQGHSNKEIASALHLTDSTIKNYLYRIFDKIGCNNRVTLAVRYVREEDCERTARAMGQVGMVQHEEMAGRR